MPTSSKKGKPTFDELFSLQRLYLSNEKARRANKREDKLYENQKQELRRKFNIELVKLEFEYQIENASKLAFEEERIIGRGGDPAPTNLREKIPRPKKLSKVPKEEKLLPTGCED